MTAEGTRRGKLAQSMTDHVLGDLEWHVTASIVYGDGMTNHLGEDYAGATPRAHNLLLALLVHRFNSFQKFGLDKRTLFQ